MSDRCPTVTFTDGTQKTDAHCTKDAGHDGAHTFVIWSRPFHYKLGSGTTELPDVTFPTYKPPPTRWEAAFDRVRATRARVEQERIDQVQRTLQEATAEELLVELSRRLQ
jgi:hypothetical protein